MSAALVEKSKGLLEVGRKCTLCGTVDFLPFVCNDCSQNYCSSHRSNHECIRQKQNVTKASKSTASWLKASQHRQQIDANASIKTGNEIHVDRQQPKNISASQSVRSQSLRSKAQGDRSVAQSDRLYLYVHRPKQPEINRAELTAPVFYSKKIMVAKLLDSVMSRFGFFTTTTGDGKQLQLLVDGIPLPMRAILQNVIQEGDTVDIVYV